MYVPFSGPFAVLDRSKSRYSNLPIDALVFVLVFLGLNPNVKREPIRNLSLQEKLQQLDPFRSGSATRSCLLSLPCSTMGREQLLLAFKPSH